MPPLQRTQISVWSNAMRTDSVSPSETKQNRHGYCVKGQRLRITKLFTDAISVSLIAACNQDGFLPHVCSIVDFCDDSNGFVSWVRDYLCPVLGNYTSGEKISVVLGDNVSQHWDARVEKLIRGSSSVLINLPRYSPKW
eukprot:501099-Rhodomonas_salina.7